MIYMRRLTGALQWTEKMADSAKGVYNFCQTVFALPCSFIPTITIAVIPAITASLTKKDLREAKSTSESAVRTMALNYVNATVEEDNPAVSYATVYPLSMFIRVIFAQLILMLFL